MKRIYNKSWVPRPKLICCLILAIVLILKVPIPRSNGRKLKVLFHSNQLGLRGTEVAIFDYGLWGSIYYNFEAHFAFPKDGQVDSSALLKFETAFPGRVHFVVDTSPYGIDKLVSKFDIDYFYKIVSGEAPETGASIIPTLLHAVFDCRNSQNFKTAAISNFVSNMDGSKCAGTVPHMAWMLDCEQTLRTELGIAKDAFVFAWQGGSDAWDSSLTDIVAEIAEKRSKDVVFLFRNFPDGEQDKLRNLANVYFLKGSSSLESKCKFIKSSDAFLHTRRRGETFGLAVAEFSLMQKPIITFASPPERFHLDTLGADCYTYKDALEFGALLDSLSHKNVIQRDFRSHYEKFSPKHVMHIFNKIFLDGKLVPKDTKQLPHSSSEQIFDNDFFETLGYKLI